MQTIPLNSVILGNIERSIADLLAIPGYSPQGAPTGRTESALLSFSQFDSVEWIDCIAALALGIFFLLGLMRGFWWQFSRIATLLAAWFLAGRYGPAGEPILAEWFDPSSAPSDLPLFLSYVIIFIFTVVILSMLARLLHKMISESGLSFYDRLGGAVLGLGTGAVAVIVVLAGIKMFVPETTSIVQAAERSMTMDYSRKTLASSIVKRAVPRKMLDLFDIPSSEPDEAPDPGAEDGGEPPQAPAGK